MSDSEHETEQEVVMYETNCCSCVDVVGPSVSNSTPRMFHPCFKCGGMMGWVCDVCLTDRPFLF